MSRRPTRFAAVLLTLALTFGPQSAAQADTQSANGFRSIDRRCSWGATWVNNEWGLPGLESVATIDASVFDWCDQKGWTTQPTEAIAVAQNLIAWDARGWEFLCNGGPWIVHDGRNGQQHEVRTWWAFNRPCNTNWYRGEGFAAVRWAGDWFGDEKPGIKTPWIFQW